MRTRRTLISAAAALLAAGVASCSDNPSGPNELPENQLLFVRAAADAPDLATHQAQVWAKVGEQRHVPILYKAQGPYAGDECLDFIIPGDALYRRPDGTPLAHGDSVLITVTVVDDKLFEFDFQPAGLQFNPSHPAELRVSYKWADPDLNGDGRVDSRDTNLRTGFWRQESSGEPWKRIGTSRESDVQELRASIRGFTRYALASN